MEKEFYLKSQSRTKTNGFFMKEHLKRIRGKGLVKLNGLMEVNIRDILIKMRGMEKVKCGGMMEQFTSENGFLVNSMGGVV